MNTKLKGLNIFTVIAGIILPIWYLMFGVSPAMNFMKDVPNGFILMYGSILIGPMLYLLTMIFGLRSIANGKVKAVKTASIFQIILYSLNVVMGGASFIHKINSYHNIDGSSRVVVDGFAVMLLILVILMLVMGGLAVLKTLLMKNHKEENSVTAGNKGLPFIIIGVFIVLPIVFVAAIIALVFFLRNHPAINQVFETIMGLLMVLPVIALIIFILKKTKLGSVLFAIFAFLGSPSGDGGSSQAAVKSNTGMSREDKTREAILKKEKATIIRALDKKHSGDKFSEFTTNVNDKAAKRRLSKIDEELSGLK